MDDLLRMTPERDPNLQEVDIRRFRVVAHQRMSNPLSHATVALIAVAALLTGPCERRGASKRVLWAIGAMLASQAAMLGAANLATGSLPFLPLIHAAVVVPLAAAAAVLLRAGFARSASRRSATTLGASS
jgi:lipopolysaccharide export LptBFGC system permease protein LptF